MQICQQPEILGHSGFRFKPFGKENRPTRRNLLLHEGPGSRNSGLRKARSLQCPPTGAAAFQPPNSPWSNQIRFRLFGVWNVRIEDRNTARALASSQDDSDRVDPDRSALGAVFSTGVAGSGNLKPGPRPRRKGPDGQRPHGPGLHGRRHGARAHLHRPEPFQPAGAQGSHSGPLLSQALDHGHAGRGDHGLSQSGQSDPG